MLMLITANGDGDDDYGCGGDNDNVYGQYFKKHPELTAPNA